MKRAIKNHLRDFIAIAGLVVIAAVIGWIIVQEQRLRVPVIEENPFDLEIEMETAQAVVAGQGQTVRVAGVRVGDVQKVELEDGKAVVTTEIDRKYLPIYRNATVLLRPKTGLKDMFFELDPGSKGAGELDEGGRIRSSNTAPDVNLDEILAVLDTDTRDYLKVLVNAAGEGLRGRSRDLGQLFREFKPLNRDLRQLNVEVAKRRRNLKRLVHNFNVLTGTLARKDRQLTELVSNSNTVFETIASEDVNLQRAVRNLPGALRETRRALTAANDLGDVLGPAFEDLRPFARRLDDMNDALRPFARRALPDVRDELRPFARTARGPLSDLKPISKRFAEATPDLQEVFLRFNKLLNTAAYNPGGAEGPGDNDRSEGYLFNAAWLSHQGNSIFQGQDAHGIYRRLYLVLTCQEALDLVNGSPLGPVVGSLTGVGSILDEAC